MTTPTESYLPLLLDGDIDAALDLFDGRPEVHDVLSGVIKEEIFYFWAGARHMWLRDRKARIEPVAVTREGERAVVEVILHLVQEGRAIPLPVAVVGDEGADKLRRVRVYHSTFPLRGYHAVRGAILPERPDLHASDVIGRYQEALARGDVETILGLFEPDAVVREPSGEPWIHRNDEQRRRFYEGTLRRGGIPLQHCSLTECGATCALEYNVRKWGDATLYTQAGVAVYARSPSGKLAGARIYDDVTPPG